jgi:V/A-type H+-transporting ATPase subunit K
MVFSVLPETQALYGFIVGILILASVGLVGAAKTGALSTVTGMAAIAAGCAVGFAGLSAIGQGIVAGGAIGATAKNKDSTGKGLVLSVIPETYAIFGLLIAILIMLGVGFFG